MDWRDDDDSDLVREYLEHRDPACFGKLVERHQDRVYRLVCSVLGPSISANGESEEVTQEVFLRVFRQLRQYRGDSAFSSWVYRIAYRCAIDVKRLARLRHPHEPHGADLATASREAYVEGEDIRRAVDALPDLYRTLVHMYYWMDCPVQEIADALGMPAGTVKSYLARARNMVKGKLR